MDIHSWFRRVHQDERGQTLVFFTLMFVVLTGFVAIVTDVGLAYWQRRDLQNAVDSAALAGASKLLPPVPDANAAKNVALAYANTNGVTTQEVNNVTDPSYQLQVTETVNPVHPDIKYPTVIVSALRHYNFGLRYLIGAGNSDIVATAAAVVAPVNPGAGDLLPWGLPSDPTNPCFANLPTNNVQPGDPIPPPTNPVICTIHFQSPPPLGPGNFGAVAYPDDPNNGGRAYRDDIANGYQHAVPTPQSSTSWGWTIQTDPGESVGNTDQGMDAVRTADEHEWCKGGTDASHRDCSNLYQASPGQTVPDPYNPWDQVRSGYVCITSTACPRVGLIPILQENTFQGRQDLTVNRFQCFYIQDIDQTSKVVTGFFLGYCSPQSNGQKTLDYDTSPVQTGLLGVVLWR